MSKDYWNERDIKSREKTIELLSYLPPFVSKFINYIMDNSSALTRENYVRDITLFLDYVCEEKGIEDKRDITVDTLAGLDIDFLSSYSIHLANYVKEGKIHKESEVTRSRRLSALRSLYKYLYISGQIPENQMSKIRSPKTDDKEIIRLEKDEAQDFLSAVTEGTGTEKSNQAKKYNEIQSLRDQTILSLMLSTGIRVSECVGLNINDVDLKRFSIRVIRKGHSEYTTLYYSDEMSDLMLDYLMYREKLEALEGSEDALFLSSRKTRMGVRAMEKMVKKYAERAGIAKHITPHKLRSSYGTALYEATGDIRAVADSLGHKSIETTSRKYVQSNKERRKALRGAVNLIRKGEETEE